MMMSADEMMRVLDRRRHSAAQAHEEILRRRQDLERQAAEAEEKMRENMTAAAKLLSSSHVDGLGMDVKTVRELHAMRLARDEAAAAAEKSRQQAASVFEAAEATQEAAAARAEAARAHFVAVHEALQERLARDNPDYAALLSQQAEIASQMEEAEHQADLARELAERRREEFEADSIFAYLERQQVLSSTPQGNALVRALDRALARVSRHAQNRRTLDQVIHREAVWTGHQEHLGQQAVALKKRIEQLEASARDEAYHAASREAHLAEEAREKAIEAADRAMEHLSAASAQVASYKSEADPLSIRLRDRWVRHLRSLSNAAKRELAAKTPSPTDDLLIEHIISAANKGADAARELGALAADEALLRRRLEDWKTVLAGARRKGYDASRVSFSLPSGFTSMLDAIDLSEQDDAFWNRFWGTMKKGYRRAAPPPPVYVPTPTRSSSSSSSGGFGGFGGGGFSSGGGFGGGGFRTGGGF